MINPTEEPEEWLAAQPELLGFFFWKTSCWGERNFQVCLFVCLFCLFCLFVDFSFLLAVVVVVVVVVRHGMWLISWLRPWVTDKSWLRCGWHRSSPHRGVDPCRHVGRYRDETVQVKFGLFSFHRWPVDPWNQHISFRSSVQLMQHTQIDASRSKQMAQIPKGRLVKGSYKPIWRDCAI